MTGTASQIEWAEQIKPRVDAEFRRVAAAFQMAADGQSEAVQNDTLAILAILEEKRLEAMANDRAGYFISNWQELTDQVRQAIAADSRYQTIKAKRIKK